MATLSQSTLTCIWSAEGGQPTSRPDGTWWTTDGSKRKLADSHLVEATVSYIRQQLNPLLIWTRDEGLIFWKRTPPDSSGA